MQKSARCVILLSWQWRKFYLYKSFMLLKRASLTNLFSVKALILPNKRQNFVVIIHHIKKEVLELHFFQDTYYTFASWCDPLLTYNNTHSIDIYSLAQSILFISLNHTRQSDNSEEKSRSDSKKNLYILILET